MRVLAFNGSKMNRNTLWGICSVPLAMSCSTPGQGRSCSLGSVIQTCIVLGMGITEIVLIGEH